jgi:dTDP-4-amino-4,6-dideoxygalactose transaminase
MTVPFLDLTRETERLRPEIDAAVDRVLSSGRFILTEEVAEFEQEFAAYCDARFAVGVASGTDAITIALAAAGVGPGTR